MTLSKSVDRPSILMRLASKVYAKRLDALERSGAATLASYHPGIVPAYAKILADTGTAGLHIAKGADLLGWLQRTKPTHIAEMGSGRTSIVFAAFAAQTGASLTIFEQDARWTSLIRPLALEIFPAAEFKTVDVLPRPLGGSFSETIPPTADFVYVDAPHVPRGTGFGTWTGKPAYYDAADFLEAGHLPSTILVDGRVDSADLIRSVATEYIFAPSVDWALAHDDLRAALRFSRHSAFTAIKPLS